MADIFNGILESDAISEDLKTQIQETWKSKLDEAREEITAELRDEFAQRYENDKGQIVEAMDTMLTDRITSEIEELKADRAALAEQTVAYKTNIEKHTSLVDKFVAEQLAKEVKELHADRTDLKNNFAKLENFVVKQLAKELTEFENDKKAVVEQKVKLVAEGKKMIAEAKQRFVSKAAKVVEKTVEKSLKSEMSQLKEDIKVAKENNFGRKVFEAFAGEYMSSYLNEGGEIRKLNEQLTDQQEKTNKMEGSLAEKDAEIETMTTKLRIAEDKIQRERTLNELVSPLSKDKRQVMSELLESVQTVNLRKQFEKYLPAVLNETAKPEQSENVVITEHTGDRAESNNKDENNDIVNIKRLAGLRS